MGITKISANTLEHFCNDVFIKFGFTNQESKRITDVLILADLYGIDSHGTQRLARYHKGIESGLILVDAKPEIIFETPISAVVDGHAGMGQLVGAFSMDLAVKKAKKVGIGIVTVRNSNHYGIAGYYANMACSENLLGFSVTNSEAIMIPTNGRKAMLGTNPIAVAMPAEPYPFLFDSATTVVTRGKLEVYNKMSKPLPLGWALDKNGHPAQDAADVLNSIKAKDGGGIMPLGGSEELLGGHKGYGFGMISEIFSSILSMGLTSNFVDIGTNGGTCHGFAALDLKAFGNPKDIIEHLSQFLQQLRDTSKAEGKERIYTHGEKEVEAMAYRRISGIPVNSNTINEMIELSNYLELDFNKYFPLLI